MQDHVAAGLERRLGAFGQGAGQRLHRQVVGDDEAAEAEIPAHQPDHLLRGGGGALRIDGGEDHVGGHGQRHVGEGAEGGEVPGVEVGQVGVHHRQVVMAVGEGAAVTGHVLDHRQDAAGQQTLGGGAAQLRHQGRLAGVGAVADDVVSAGHRHVQHRQAVDGDPDPAQVVGHQPGPETDQFAGRQRVVGRLEEGVGGRVFGPVRRAHALDPTALLVDQDRRVGIVDGLAQLVSQGAQLVGVVDVAAEDDEAPWAGVGEEDLLLRRQPKAGAAVDRRRARHRTMQSPPEALMALHRPVACSRLRPETVVR